MERNRWETALRCLEVALHPNTDDDEVIAGVNGFRRTAAGMPLREVCARFMRGRSPGLDADERADELDRLSQENLDLRRQLDAAEAMRTMDTRRVGETEDRLRSLAAELAAARRRAEAAERRLEECGATYAAIADDLRDQIAGLRGALGPARHDAAQRIPAGPMPRFRDVLAAAHRGMPAASVAAGPKPPERGLEAADAVRRAGMARRPWTA